MGVQAQIRRPLRVLIVRVGAMGDVLHGLPAAMALREAMPDCFIGWAVEPRWMGLVGGVVDRVHEVPTRDWKARPFSVRTLRQIAALRRQMRAERYDVCVDLQGSIRSAVIGRLAEAGRFVGPRKPRERQARALYGERVAVTAEHVVGQACELVGAGCGLTLAAAEVRLPVDAAAERWCDEMRVGEGFVLLAPGGGWGAKRWPRESFRELGQRLRAEGFRVLVNASSADDEAAQIGEVVVSTVPQLIALTRRAGLVVGGDTGPVHLAAALGRPVVGLYGPTDPLRTGRYFPGGGRVRVLRDAASRVDHSRIAETEAGLRRISVDEVMGAALALLRGSDG